MAFRTAGRPTGDEALHRPSGDSGRLVGRPHIADALLAVFDDLSQNGSPSFVDRYAGLAAPEVDHHDNLPEARERGLAAEQVPLVTGTSDYHGNGKPNRVGVNNQTARCSTPCRAGLRRQSRSRMSTPVR